MSEVSLASIQEAARRLEGLIRITPLLDGGELSRETGCEVRLKMESMQRTGSFKFRGATNAVARLPESTSDRGVITHSSGNHALALATAARARGFPCTVVMPTDAPATKRLAVQQAGARIVDCEPTMQSREATLAREVAAGGATVIPPFDHADVVSGQGTIGLEVLQQWPEVQAIVVPVGGGGLVGGIATAVKASRPGVAVIGAEPRVADDALRGKASGVRQPPTNAPTLADGLRAGLGTITFPIVRDLVDHVLPVEEVDIAAWMRFAFERLKLVIEASAAVGVAASASPGFKAMARQAGWRRVAIVICGGNTDLHRLPWLS